MLDATAICRLRSNSFGLLNENEVRLQKPSVPFILCFIPNIAIDWLPSCLFCAEGSGSSGCLHLHKTVPNDP